MKDLMHVRNKLCGAPANGLDKSPLCRKGYTAITGMAKIPRKISVRYEKTPLII